MMFNTTLNNISAISWQHGSLSFIVLFVCLMVFNTTFNIISVLLVVEIGGPGENHCPATSH